MFFFDRVRGDVEIVCQMLQLFANDTGKVAVVCSPFLHLRNNYFFTLKKQLFHSPLGIAYRKAFYIMNEQYFLYPYFKSCFNIIKRCCQCLQTAANGYSCNFLSFDFTPKWVLGSHI